MGATYPKLTRQSAPCAGRRNRVAYGGRLLKNRRTDVIDSALMRTAALAAWLIGSLAHGAHTVVALTRGQLIRVGPTPGCADHRRCGAPRALRRRQEHRPSRCPELRLPPSPALDVGAQGGRSRRRHGRSGPAADARVPTSGRYCERPAVTVQPWRAAVAGSLKSRAAATRDALGDVVSNSETLHDAFCSRVMLHGAMRPAVTPGHARVPSASRSLPQVRGLR
jgi:hypothetical protein